MRRLKKPVIYSLIVILSVSIIYVIEMSFFTKKFEDDDYYDYVSKTILEDTTPVVNVEQVIIKPFVDNNVQVLKYFYNYKDEKARQEKSLIFNNDTYFQNSGIDYGGVEKFDVVCIMDGTVITVSEDQLLGNYVEIRHNNDFISTYQSLSEIKVKKDDVLKQGDVIGINGSSNLDKDLGDHLHFELIYKGEVVNPEEFYFKKISDLLEA